MRVHWNIWLMAALGLLSIAAFLQLASLLRDLTRLKRTFILIFIYKDRVNNINLIIIFQA